MKTKNLAELYELAPLDWDAASASLPEGQARDADGGAGRHTAWLTTINADGSPHVSGVGATALLVNDPGGATSWSFHG
jgi:hypothetical protein